MNVESEHSPFAKKIKQWVCTLFFFLSNECISLFILDEGYINTSTKVSALHQLEVECTFSALPKVLYADGASRFIKSIVILNTHLLPCHDLDLNNTSSVQDCREIQVE